MSRQDMQKSGPNKDDEVISKEIRTAYDRLAENELPGPPEMLDQAVLNRAHAEVDKPRSSRPWSFGWLHALSTAAVIVLGLTVILQFREQVPPSVPVQQSTPLSEPSPSAAPAGIVSDEAASAPAALRQRVAESKVESRSESVEEALVTPMRNVATPPAAIAEDRALAEPELREDPQAWLAEIRGLLEAGNTQQAEEELARFREQWPDIPVPADLDE